MLKTNATFRQQTVEALVGFVQGAHNRTADVVADLRVLTAQVWCWSKLPEDVRDIEADDPQAAGEKKSLDKADFKKFARFTIEELLRR